MGVSKFSSAFAAMALTFGAAPSIAAGPWMKGEQRLGNGRHMGERGSGDEAPARGEPNWTRRDSRKARRKQRKAKRGF